MVQLPAAAAPDVTPGPFKPSNEMIIAHAAGGLHRAAVNAITPLIARAEPVVTVSNGLNAAIKAGRLQQREADVVLAWSKLVHEVPTSPDGTPSQEWLRFVPKVMEESARIFDAEDASPLGVMLASIARDNAANPPPGVPGHRDYKWWHVDIFVAVVTADPIVGAAASAIAAL